MEAPFFLAPVGLLGCRRYWLQLALFLSSGQGLVDLPLTRSFPFLFSPFRQVWHHRGSLIEGFGRLISLWNSPLCVIPPRHLGGAHLFSKWIVSPAYSLSGLSGPATLLSIRSMSALSCSPCRATRLYLRALSPPFSIQPKRVFLP